MTPFIPAELRQWRDFDHWLHAQPGVSRCDGVPWVQAPNDGALHTTCCDGRHLAVLPHGTELEGYLAEWAAAQHPSVVERIAEECLQRQRLWARKAAARLRHTGQVGEFTAACLAQWRANRRFWLALTRNAT